MLDERKFPGQTNNATKFYNSLNLVDLRSVLRQNFPILVGIAARIHFDFSTTQKTSLLSYIKALQPVFSVSAGGLVVSYLDERQQQYIKNYGLFVRAKKGYTLDQSKVALFWVEVAKQQWKLTKEVGKTPEGQLLICPDFS